MITRRYKLINNVTGWIVFVIALVTYWLTLEPTASYWDCGEFIIQADKLEVGHPPGNPIFMLTARFFANFASDAAHVSLMVNAMSGLLSALTILLLFWTVTHLTRRLVVKDDANEMSLAQYLVVIGSGVVGALAYCWSDTFWFSAVEGEVYAFSSFCTALVFWLILKWESHADAPHSDRYLILIAYIIGVSIAVHLLNLLCIPAIVLVFAYRKWDNMNLKKSLLALLISFVMVALVLFGLVPGFIKMAQQFELLFVNGFHCPFNSGALVYALVAAALFVWAIFELRIRKSPLRIKISFFLAVFISGMPFMGSGWVLGWVLLALLAAWLVSTYCNPVPVRVMNVIMWSIAVIFIGYSSYALILIRSSADTPMNQNSPDNVFDLASYLNREQYGDTPLLYGETLYSGQQKRLVSNEIDTIRDGADFYPVAYPQYEVIVNPGKKMYAKGVKGATPKSEYNFLSANEIKNNEELAARGGDYYVLTDRKQEIKLNPELNMFFPRIYSRMHREAYKEWVLLDTMPSNLKEINAIDEESGDKVPEVDFGGQPYVTPSGLVSYPQKFAYRPSYSQNLAYFFNYQLVHMYMRYFMWNFAGRQNDVLNQHGEMDAGNWITGIPVLDNARLGDQSLLPDDLGKNNKGHNVFYMLPLLLGIIGLVWQSFAGKRGIEQFWVIFFLFFMTGIAIVLYLNQPPLQPRERDYAFAGSFYAFAIWIGMGVAGLYRILTHPKLKEEYAAGIAVVLGLIVPFQMVSQTWDDHDRSGRYAARDYAINYLESLEPNAIIFCNGDNDTFPLWYAQEVEGIRPDVKIVNLSYLASDWYVNQMRQQTYDAAPIKFTAEPQDVAYGKLDVTIPGREKAPADLLSSLKTLYSGASFDVDYGYPMLPSSVVSIPVDKQKVIERGLVAAKDSAEIVDHIIVDLGNASSVRSKGYISLSELMMLDIIATNAANGWERPIYWASTVGPEYHLGLSDYLKAVGMNHQLLPTMQEGLPARTDRGYDVVTKKYLWGGADTAGKAPYFDETARRMLIGTRTSMLDVAVALEEEGDMLKLQGDEAGAKDKYTKALEVVRLVDSKLSEKTATYGVSVALTLPDVMGHVAGELGDKAAQKRALTILEEALERFGQYLAYNAMIQRNFGNVSMTTESRLLPYQYYRFIELYETYGGNSKNVDKILQKIGTTREQVKQNYERAYGNYNYDDYESTSDTYTEADYVNELAEAAKTVNELAAMSPEEYAQQNEDNRYLDSIFYAAYEQYIGAGISKEAIDANPDIQKVDMARSKRLSEEYSAKHGQ